MVNPLRPRLQKGKEGRGHGANYLTAVYPRETTPCWILFARGLAYRLTSRASTVGRPAPDVSSPAPAVSESPASLGVWYAGGPRRHPSVVRAALLPELIGQGRARRLLLTGETIGAAEALAWGLVDVVTPAGGFDDAVERLVGSILPAGPQAIRLQKSLILECEELPTAAAITRGTDCFVSAIDTDGPARMAGARLAELRSRSTREPAPRTSPTQRATQCR